ncbi:hypothetical protein [Rhodoferax sp. PAMC 29310]|uniref:hypothetical protein n=1 Tax=Rhodoferax sp. PAMC 29310 TaxID=2822760 RepID=UPI001B3376BA|nr:hypothetical protein [Rhodoferax sp. PAMC 29310]
MLLIAVAGALGACGGGSDTTPTVPVNPNRGFANAAPWVSYYGSAAKLDLAKMAATFRNPDIDADPGLRNFSATQVKQLQNRGANKVTLPSKNVLDFTRFRRQISASSSKLLECQRAQLV